MSVTRFDIEGVEREAPKGKWVTAVEFESLLEAASALTWWKEGSEAYKKAEAYVDVVKSEFEGDE
ncbi:hypothetical protein N9112_00400 [bacterium]|nr:hypothetical protein [bacterium]